MLWKSLEMSEGGKGPQETVSAGQEGEQDPATAVTLAQNLTAALEAKAEGNTRFNVGAYDDALELYTQAIDLVEDDCDQRAVFYANRAACYSKMGEHKLVVEDCTSALELREDYAKALHRRSSARESLGEYQPALDDMKRVVELEPSNSLALAAIPRLESAAKAKLEEQKEEMLGKLKDLGNSVLGRFGMSLDNFKAVQDPSTGSYSISFNQ